MRRHIIAAPLLMGIWVSAAAAQDTTKRNMPDTGQRANVMNQAQLSDSAVLARMHTINQHEIRLGELAQRNGSAQQVKTFATRLVRDHRAADERVREVAEELDIKLPDKDKQDHHGQMRDQRTPGQGRDTTAQQRDTTNRMGDPAYPQRDTTGQANRPEFGRQQPDQQKPGDREHAQLEQRLQNLRGAAFDSAFARAMVQGHQRTIELLQQAQQQVENDELKSLIASTLPTVREHHRIAQQLASGVVTTTSER